MENDGRPFPLFKNILKMPLKEGHSMNIFSNLSSNSIKEARLRANAGNIFITEKRAGEASNPPVCSTQTDISTDHSSTGLSTERAGFYDQTLVRLNNSHKLLNSIGEGSFGKIYKCIGLNDGVIKAAKIMKPKNIKSALQEAELLSQLHSHGCNVPKYFDAWTENKQVVILMGLCEGNLAKKLKQVQSLGSIFSEGEINNFISQITPTLSRLHNLGYAHMDLKPGKRLIT